MRLDKVIRPLLLQPDVLAEFQFIQDRAFEVALSLNPSARFGCNINSQHQNEIYSELENPNGKELPSGDLTWDNFNTIFPEYSAFCRRFTLYEGYTVIGRSVISPHRHGTGEYTYTFPWKNCDGVKVSLLSPTVPIFDVVYMIDRSTPAIIDSEYVCASGQPFTFQSNLFHMTSLFEPGSAFFTVWHHMS